MRRTADKRKIARMVVVVAAVLAIVLGVIWQKLFVVRQVVIEGDVQASQEEIVRAAKVEFGGHISRVNEDALRANLESGGSYALEGVRKRYPNTVILTVRQRTKDAVVVNGGQYLVLDSDGYVIEQHASMPENSGVYVYGLNATSYRIGSRITAPEDRLATMKTVLEAVRNVNAAQYISDIDISDSESLRITTRTGIVAQMGDLENLENKMRWLCSAVSDLEARGETHGTLDITSGDKADFKP